MIMGIKGIVWAGKGGEGTKGKGGGAYISSSLRRMALCTHKVFLVICIQVIMSNSSRT